MLIKGEWESFVEMVVPPDASAIQRQEMRRAFYAGAKAVLGILLTVYRDGEPTQEDQDKIDSIHLELETFKNAVAEGRA